MTTPSRRRRISRSGVAHDRRRTSSPPFVAISVDGKTQVHAKGSHYDSLCGLDGNDPAIGQVRVPLPAGAKIDCPECRQMWAAWARFTAEDFI